MSRPANEHIARLINYLMNPILELHYFRTSIPAGVAFVSVCFLLCVVLGCQEKAAPETVEPSPALSKKAKTNELLHTMMAALAEADFVERDGGPIGFVSLPANSNGVSRQVRKLLSNAAIQCQVATGKGKNYLAYKEEGHPIDDEFVARFQDACLPLIPWLTEEVLRLAVDEAEAGLEKERNKKSVFNIGQSAFFKCGPIKGRLEFSEQFSTDEFSKASATATISWTWELE